MIISDLKHGLFKYEVKDYYAILGVPVFSSPKEVRLRYLKLAYQLHPDTNRAETKEEKKQASDILSKVVNPAYENLYKEKLRKECQLILSEISRRLAPEIAQITLTSELAKKLLEEEEESKLEKIYKETIEKIGKDQYQDINKIHIKIGLLSELNMIYLVRQKQGKSSQVTRATSSPSPIASTEGIIYQQPTTTDTSTEVENQVTEVQRTTSSKKEPVSRLDKLIMSATKHLETGNFDPAILDLREALKLDANNPIVHALLGSLYLEQDNQTYARIHIKKAVDLEPNEPKVKEAKQKFKEKYKESIKSSKGKKAQSKSDSKSSKSAKKSEDKKEPPTIFGIPLW